MGRGVALRFLIGAVVLGVAVTLFANAVYAADANGMKPAAQADYDLGGRYFSVGQYADAIQQFRAGFVIDPQPVFLYAIAQAERLQKDCPDALLEYRQFLDQSAASTDPLIVEKRDNAVAMTAECQAAATQPATGGSPTVHAKTSAGTPKGVQKPANSTRANPLADQPAGLGGESLWDRRKVAILASVGTAVVLGAGATFALLGRSADNAYHSYPGSPQAAEHDASTARGDYLAGNILLGAGVAAAALTTYLWLRAPDGGAGPADRVAWSVCPLPGAAIATFSGSWGGP
jgi:hypothetical protein